MPETLRPGVDVALRVPASSANLGPGFDSVGLALGLWDRGRARVTAEPGLRVEVLGAGAQELPRDDSHLVVRAMHATWRHLDVTPPAGLHLSTENGIPQGRGLGSSAAAIVLGAALAHALLSASRAERAGLDLDLVNHIASGLEGHPDNASASVYGGATLSTTGDSPTGQWPTVRTVPLRLHAAVVPVVVVPDATLSTTTARAVLPPSVSLRTAAASTARGALLVHALTSDPALLVEGTCDLLHQEARRASYPASMALLDRLRGAGHAATISGAGPSVLVLDGSGAVEPAAAAITDLAGPAWRVLLPGVPTHGVAPV